MADSYHTDRPGEHLDDKLNASALAVTPADPQLQQELESLVVASRKEAEVKFRMFGLSRGAAVGLAACVLLGGGAAAWAVPELHSYWQERGMEPHGGYTFELPSGAVCEYEIRMMPRDPGYEDSTSPALTPEQQELAERIQGDAQKVADEVQGTEEFEEQVDISLNPSAVSSDTDPPTEDTAYFAALDSQVSWELQQRYQEEMDELLLGGYTMGHSCPGADFGDSWLNYVDMNDPQELEIEE